MSKSASDSSQPVPSSSTSENTDNTKECADSNVAKRRAANYLSGGGIVLVNAAASRLSHTGSQARASSDEDTSDSATARQRQSSQAHLPQDMNRVPSGPSLMSVGVPMQLWVPVMPMNLHSPDMGLGNLSQLMPTWLPTAQQQFDHNNLIASAWLQQQAALMAAAAQQQALPATFCVQPSSGLSVPQVLTSNKAQLEQCGWYYGRLSNAQAMSLLKSTSAGTFLVRDSSDARFAFSLSVQRGGAEGPTSVRVAFRNGAFMMDAAADMAVSMPEFSSVLDLVEYYMRASACEEAQTESSSSYRHVWMEDTGKLSSRICMRKPLHRKVPSLGHLTRLAIHKTMAASDSTHGVAHLNLPAKLEAYLREYPHGI